MAQFRDGPEIAWILGGVALLLAAASAKPYAGGWNDGSRLAAIESLLDRQTLAIDDSIFVKVPPELVAAGMAPYPADRADLLQHGTLDKLFINGHFYSDKPLATSVIMAGMYRPLQWLGAPAPRERPDRFIRLMTILTCGLGYAVAVGCLWSLGRVLRLDPSWRLIWLGAFAVGTYSLTYTQQMNSGAVQLGLVAAMCRLLVRERPWGAITLLALGALAGLAFLQDFGSGPPLVACMLGLVAWRMRSAHAILWTTLGVVPFVVFGLGMNYVIGGVWKPLNMVPAHFAYPGSPFNAENITGFFRHKPVDQVLYAAGMLFGKHGFLNHNLPLLLALTAGASVLWKSQHRVELGGLLAWCGITWLMYAVLSNNMGGACCSIRWFVPFLAPGFWLLAEILKSRPELGKQFLTLAIGGGMLGAFMVWKGPWTMRMVPMLWPVLIGTLVAWSVVVRRERRTPAKRIEMSEAQPRLAA